MTLIKMKSSDDVTFELDLKAANYFGIIKTMLEDIPVTGDGEMFELPTVNSDVLGKIIAWVTYHSKNDPPAEEQGKPSSLATEQVEMSSWDAEFLKMDMAILHQLNVAADYLNIKGLYELTSKAAADLIQGKDVDEIRLMFDMDESDFPVDEERRIRMENEWMELEEGGPLDEAGI